MTQHILCRSFGSPPKYFFLSLQEMYDCPSLNFWVDDHILAFLSMRESFQYQIIYIHSSVSEINI